MAQKMSASKLAVWVLLGLLIVGLAGFGATNLSGNVRNVGKIGEMPISTTAYFNAMQRELRAMQQQTGQVVTMVQAREFGLDRAVLQRLVTARALDNEAAQMGLSIGDENVRDQVLSFGAFQGLDGSFDREAYAFALEQQGLNEGEFEQTLREETARTLLQSAIVNGVSMPDTFADTLVAYAGERRDFSWSVLDISVLEDPLTPATEADLRAFYDANPDQFTLPVTKRITYAQMTPDMLIDTVELDENALRQAYDDRLEEFSQPERRLVERLVFLNDTAAEAAATRLNADEADFETLVEERGLSLQDVDMGDVGRLELDAAGEAVFAADVGDVVGPLPSSLGPAFFRINGVLPAQSVSFEEARPQLRETAALDRARRIITNQAESYEDLLAGGATLEDLAQETEMELGSIDWSVQAGDDIAAYEDFRIAAANLTLDDFPEIMTLEDGGIFAMRLEEELPERPNPFDAAREDVSAALEIDRTEKALTARAETLVAQLNTGSDFPELGLTVTVEEDRTRGAFVPRTPPTFLTEVFKMQTGDIRVISGNGIVTIVRLDGISAASNSDEARDLRNSLQATLNQAVAEDLFQIFAQDVLMRTETEINQQAIDAVNANFP